ncbi:hypothetical protein [Alicycliphilus denitrificans]|uniref:hypothetical protein n=1 Tax=Alicycliphilus denitrificans TaxID=179636 RepID=UPI00384D92B3
MPTLTDVVHLSDDAQLVASKLAQVPAAEAAPLAPVPVAVAAAQALAHAPLPEAENGARNLPAGMEEYVVHRVMQRVDLVLDQRLREAIALVVQEQTRSMVPRLREEVESVVRHAVYEAVADELAGDSRPH